MLNSDLQREGEYDILLTIHNSHRNQTNVFVCALAKQKKESFITDKKSIADIE